MRKIVLFTLLSFYLVVLFNTQIISANPFILGQVLDAEDGTSSNGYTVILWGNGNVFDQVTDIVGLEGNSATPNTYLFDCGLLENCNIGSTIYVKIISNNSYTTTTASLVITGNGFEQVPDLQLVNRKNDSCKLWHNIFSLNC